MNYNQLTIIFEDFFYELIETKNSVLDKKKNKVIFTEQKIQEILDNFFTRIVGYNKLYDSLNDNQPISEFFQELIELQYIMSSLTDEIFLHIDWNGKDYWEKNLLEEKIFHTHISGTEIFRRIDDILQNKVLRSTEIIRAYIIMLSMGYRGKYRIENNQNDQEDIVSRYKIKLLHKAYENKNLNEELKIFPKSYNYTIQNFETNSILKRNIAYYLIIILSLSYILLSSLIWRISTYNMSNEIDNLVSNLLSSEEK